MCLTKKKAKSHEIRFANDLKITLSNLFLFLFLFFSFFFFSFVHKVQKKAIFSHKHLSNLNNSLSHTSYKRPNWNLVRSVSAICKACFRLWPLAAYSDLGLNIPAGSRFTKSRNFSRYSPIEILHHAVKYRRQDNHP